LGRHDPQLYSPQTDFMGHTKTAEERKERHIIHREARCVGKMQRRAYETIVRISRRFRDVRSTIKALIEAELITELERLQVQIEEMHDELYDTFDDERKQISRKMEETCARVDEILSNKK